MPEQSSGFAARLGFCGGILQRFQKIPDLLNALGADPIVHPLALFPALDNAGVAQKLHVVGQGRLADAQFLQQPAGTLFSAAKQLQNLQPVFIAERLENLGIFLI